LRNHKTQAHFLKLGQENIPNQQTYSMSRV